MDLSIFPAYLEEVCPRIADGGLRIASFHLPFGTYRDISSPDETIRAGAVQALAQLIRLLAPYPGSNLVLHPSFEPIEEGEREAHIAACQKSLRELGPVARTGKIARKICPQIWARRRKWSASQRSGALRHCMDTTRMFRERRRTFCGAGKWVINTHLSDYLNGQDECHWVPGTGSLHWREIFAALIALPYGGTWQLEVFKHAPAGNRGRVENALER